MIEMLGLFWSFKLLLILIRLSFSNILNADTKYEGWVYEANFYFQIKTKYFIKCNKCFNSKGKGYFRDYKFSYSYILIFMCQIRTLGYDR